MQDLSTLPTITEGVVRHELANGLTLLVRPVPESPATAIVTRVNTGYFHEPDELAGISHVVEHMFFNGTANRPDPEAISRETQALGGRLNAATAYDHTTYYAVLPAENWAEGLEIQADALQNPLFDPGVLEKELGAVKQEALRKLDDPAAFGRESMFALAHEHHRIRRWRIGTEEVLDSLDREMLVRWFEDHYRPGNVILSIAGDVDPDEVVARVEALYGQMERGHLRQSGGPSEPAQKALRYRRMNAQLKRAYLYVGFPTPGVGHKDNPALDVLATILGRGQSSRLFARLRDELGAVTSVRAAAWQYEDIGMFEIGAVCDPLYIDMTTRELALEIERLRRYGPTDGEMERARRILLAGQAFDLEEVLGQANLLAAYEADGSYLDYDREMRDLLTVRARDVSRVLDKYLGIDRMNILEYVPWGTKSGPTAEEYREHLDGIFVAAARHFGPPSFPPLSDGLRPQAEREQWAAELAERGPGPGERSRFELPRGGTLIVEENATAPTTSVGVWFRGGRIAEIENYVGVTQVMQRMMLHDTLHRTREQITREIESLGSGLGPVTQDDWFGFRTAGLAEDLPHQLDVLFDVVTSPTMSEDAFKAEVRLRKPVVEGVEDSTRAYADELLKGLLYGAHPYGRPFEGTIPGLMGLSRPVVEEFYFDQVRPETMVVVVSGAVEAEIVHRMVQTYVEGWDYRGLPLPSGAEAFYSLERFQEPEVVAEHPMRRAERLRAQSTVMAGWPTVDRNHPDRAPLALLAEITGGLGGTFFEEIRTRRGLAYQVSTANRSRVLGGEFVVYAASSPDSIDVVRHLLNEMTRDLAQSVPGDDQIERARASLLGAWKIGGQTNAVRAGRLAVVELTAPPGVEPEDWPRRIESVTAEDLLRVARQWLDREPPGTALIAGQDGSTADPH